jgi:hypothetical protein
VQKSRRTTVRSDTPASPIAASQAGAFRRLFGAELIGAIQVGREYPGRIAIDDATLAQHFAGEIAVALRVGNGKGRSRQLVFDVDARAGERIPLLCDELRRRGYGNATLVTAGSTPERGKVAVFFFREQQNAALRALAADVLRAVRPMTEWGVEATTDEIGVYPLRGEGGLVRIGGRNVGRNGPLEALYNAWGEPCGFQDIAPVPTSLRAAQDPRAPVRTSPRQPWVDRAMRDGLTWIGAGGTRGINAFVNRLALETIRTHGSADYGRAEYRRVLETIASASPDLVRPSPKNRDRRHPLGWGRRAESAWERNCANSLNPNTTFSAPARNVVLGSSVVRAGSGGSSLDLSSGSHGVSVGPPSGVTETSTTPSRAARNRRPSHAIAEAVALLATIVKRRGLNPLAFEVAYREGGAMLGISHISFRDRILRAETCGLVVRVDPGLQGSGGRYTGRPGGGAKTLYALVPVGETSDRIRTKAEAHHAAIRRKAFVRSERARLELLERSAQKRPEPLIAGLPPDSGPALLAYARSVLGVRNDPSSTTMRNRGPDREPQKPAARTIVDIQKRIREIRAEPRLDSS